MTDEPIVVGAAMLAEELPHFREWLLERQRDLEIQDAINPAVLEGDWKPIIRDIKTYLDGYTGRMGIHGPFIDLPLGAIDPKIRAVVVERYKQALGFAAELGATHMVIHSPIQHLGKPQNKPQRTMNRVAETLQEVLPLAQEANCTLVIENIFGKRPDWHADLVRTCDSEFIRASIDTGHAYINHMDVAPPPDTWIRQVGDLLGHIHLQDTDGYSDRHWAPGQGSIKWYSVFRAIAKLEQRPRLIIEMMDTKRDVPVAAKYFADHGLAV